MKATGKFNNADIEATAINPGDYFGKTYLLVHESDYFVVEAADCSSAIDLLADSEHGKFLLIDNLEDYGYEDGGKYYNFLHQEVPSRLKEPSFSSFGDMYDAENVQVYEWKCLYDVGYDPAQ